MDKTDRKTRNLMNVESFSQLPFIRPAPPLVKEKGVGAIRLFGKEFGGSNTTTDDQSDSNCNINNATAREGEANKDGGDSREMSSRKLECHYCCRNFPTAQALGGHQNAHKRERQQAKRAHLLSAMVHGGLADARVHGITNYIGSTPTLSAAYHSWSNSSSVYNGGSKHYGGCYSSYNGHQPQPIDGSPMGLWRIPAAHSWSVYIPERSMHHEQVPMFNSKDDLKPLSPISSIPSSQLRFGYESKPDIHGHLSLDLHL